MGRTRTRPHSRYKGKGLSAEANSHLTSSLIETSEDEEGKRKDAEREEKKVKKGLSEEEKMANVDIILEETNTITMLYIPSISVMTESEENEVVNRQVKAYQDLLKNKVGSDSYNTRGSQTFNLTQKVKEVAPDKIFMMKDVQVQATNWDIDDASN